jgi:hypothetical protein
MPRPLFTSGKNPVSVVQKAGWAPGPVWTGAENLAPIGIRSPDRQARSQSLYQLSYPLHTVVMSLCNITYRSHLMIFIHLDMYEDIIEER